MYGKRNKFTKGVFFLIMATVFVFVLGSVVMWLWNTLLPDLTGVKEITFWQAVGLFILSRILFGGFRWGGSQHKQKWKAKRKAMWREKMAGMDEDKKADLKAKWRNYCDNKK